MYAVGDLIRSTTSYRDIFENVLIVSIVLFIVIHATQENVSKKCIQFMILWRAAMVIKETFIFYQSLSNFLSKDKCLYNFSKLLH